jgi:5-methylcytosine-specific restriction endonuclease McrA
VFNGKIGVVDRACGWCDSNIGHLRSNAQYCCIQHKKNAASKRHRERNPGYYAKYVGSPARVAWMEANRDRLRAVAREQQRRYRSEHPDAAREWWAANHDRHRLYQATRRSKRSSGASIVTERDIRRLVNRYRGCCAYCGDATAKLTIDHVVPFKRGGRHTIGNLVPACQSCNSSKGARLLSAWRVTVLLTNYARTLET